MSEDIRSTSRAYYDQLHQKLESALNALRFVRKFFTDLEDSSADDPKLSELRTRYHAPVHAEIDKVLGPR